MKNGEVLQKLLTLTEENARMKAALKTVKHFRDEAVKDKRNCVLDLEEADAILNIAGMADREVQAIYFDNDSTEVAYHG